MVSRDLQAAGLFVAVAAFAVALFFGIMQAASAPWNLALAVASVVAVFAIAAVYWRLPAKPKEPAAEFGRKAEYRAEKLQA